LKFLEIDKSEPRAGWDGYCVLRATPHTADIKLNKRVSLFVLRLNVITVSTGRVCAVSGKTGCHEQSDDKVYDFGRGWPAAGVGNQLGSFGAYRVLDIRP